MQQEGVALVVVEDYRAVVVVVVAAAAAATGIAVAADAVIAVDSGVVAVVERPSDAVGVGQSGVDGAVAGVAAAAAAAVVDSYCAVSPRCREAQTPTESNLFGLDTVLSPNLFWLGILLLPVRQCQHE